jgi:hexosaminidase
MRERDTSLWDLTRESKIETHFERLRQEMLPDDTPRGPQLLQHLGWDKPVTLSVAPDRRYPGSGRATLTDGVLGVPQPRDRRWLGFEGEDVTVTIDLEAAVAVERVSARFLQQTDVGIYPARKVELSGSIDGKTFEPLGTASPVEVTGEQNGSVHTLAITPPPASRARYLRLKSRNFGPLPKGRILRNGRRAIHERPSWLFMDEIVVDGEGE